MPKVTTPTRVDDAATIHDAIATRAAIATFQRFAEIDALQRRLRCEMIDLGYALARLPGADHAAIGEALAQLTCQPCEVWGDFGAEVTDEQFAVWLATNPEEAAIDAERRARANGTCHSS